MPENDDQQTQDPPHGDNGSGGGAGNGGGSDDWAEVRKLGTPTSVLELIQNARKWERRAKDNADKAEAYDKLQESQKSEQEKLTEAREAADRRAAEAEQRALRLEVAAEKGLTPAQAKRLQGTSREELEGDADELLSTFRAADDGDDGAGDPLRRRPQERTRPGGRPNTEPEISPKDVVDKVMERTAF